MELRRPKYLGSVRWSSFSSEGGAGACSGAVMQSQHGVPISMLTAAPMYGQHGDASADCYRTDSSCSFHTTHIFTHTPLPSSCTPICAEVCKMSEPQERFHLPPDSHIISLTHRLHITACGCCTIITYVFSYIMNVCVSMQNGCP